MSEPVKLPSICRETPDQNSSCKPAETRNNIKKCSRLPVPIRVQPGHIFYSGSKSNNAIPQSRKIKPFPDKLSLMRYGDKTGNLEDYVASMDKPAVDQEWAKLQSVLKTRAAAIKATEARIVQQKRTIVDLREKQRENSHLLAAVTGNEMKVRLEHRKLLNEAARARVQQKTDLLETTACRGRNATIQEDIIHLQQDIALIRKRAAFKSDDHVRKYIDEIREDTATQQVFNSFIQQDVNNARKRSLAKLQYPAIQSIKAKGNPDKEQSRTFGNRTDIGLPPMQNALNVKAVPCHVGQTSKQQKAVSDTSVF